VAARPGAGAVARELDEVERERDANRSAEVGQEDDARLERPDEERLAARVVACDLAAELGRAPRQLLGGEVDLADVALESQDARSKR
jgi:hypothetical protein